MDELMIHVERIVRPVSAFASRKLRMRRELLGHLNDALQEERPRDPADEPAAIARACQRLGDPAELTRQFQRAVPIVERLLMSKLPVSRTVERLEVRTGRLLYGAEERLPLEHGAMLAFAVGVVWLPLYAAEPVRHVLNRTGAPVHVTLFFAGLCVGLNLMVLLAYRLALAAAQPTALRRRARTARLAMLIVAIQIASFVLATFAANDRLPAITDLALIMALTLAALAFLNLVSHWVSRLRQSYDPWLQLDVAD